jgi:hypothetical protein
MSSFFFAKNEVISIIITGVIAVLVTSVKKRPNLGPSYGEGLLPQYLYYSSTVL